MEFTKKTIVIRDTYYERLRREAFFNKKQIKEVLDDVLKEHFSRHKETKDPGVQVDLMMIKDNSMIKAIKEALKQTNGNITQASGLLGITKQYLYKLIKKHNIKIEKKDKKK